jgi:hypothetical protein
VRRTSLRVEKPQPLVAGAKVANRARWGEPIQAECSTRVDVVALGVFIFFSLALALDRRGELGDAVL